MTVQEVEFVVEQAGCPSCAARLRAALEAIAPVISVDVDETEDTASIRLQAHVRVSRKIVDRVLGAASNGSGHTYRRKPGTWLVRS